MRLGILAGVTLLIVAVGKYTGLVDQVSTESIRDFVNRAGAWGFLIYVAAFAGGELVHVPGMVFVAAGILAWGKVLGFVLGLIGSVVSISVSFVLVRAIGGKAIAEIERPFVKRMLAHLETRPILTVAGLRTVLWLAPALNYALALTTVRFRDYVIGSMIGLIPPLAAASLFFEWIFAK